MLMSAKSSYADGAPSGTLPGGPSRFPPFNVVSGRHRDLLRISPNGTRIAAMRPARTAAFHASAPVGHASPIMSQNMQSRFLLADGRLEKLVAAFAYHVPVAHL
jgi:hypothetical protein